MTAVPSAPLALTLAGRPVASGSAGKRALRASLAAHGVPVPRFWTADETERIRPALARSGYPAVIKPDALGGGRGVYLVTSAQQVPGWLAMLGQYQYRGPVLAEEYVAGPQLTVLTRTDGGQHQVIAVIATELSLPPLFVGMGHVYSTSATPNSLNSGTPATGVPEAGRRSAGHPGTASRVSAVTTATPSAGTSGPARADTGAPRAVLSASTGDSVAPARDPGGQAGTSNSTPTPDASGTSQLSHTPEASRPPEAATCTPESPGTAGAASTSDAAGAVALAALDACGHTAGPAQVSVRLGTSGPVVVGLHRGESCDPVMRLPEHAAAAARQRGAAPAVQFAAVHATAAAAHFWLPAGDVESVGALAPIRALPWVAELSFGFRAGDRLPQITDARTRHGHVTVTAADPRQAAERIATVKDMLAVTVRPRLPFGTVPRPRSPRRGMSSASHQDPGR